MPSDTRAAGVREGYYPPPADEMVVVFAIEPRSYRQAVGEAIRSMRPHVEVVVLEPGTLEAAVARLEPHLVFADRPAAASGGPTGRPAWVEFSPYEQPPARVRLLDGRTRELEEVGLSDLLSIVDETEELWRTNRAPGNR